MTEIPTVAGGLVTVHVEVAAPTHRNLELLACRDDDLADLLEAGSVLPVLEWVGYEVDRYAGRLIVCAVGKLDLGKAMRIGIVLIFLVARRLND